jgi:hypothetical protein
LTGPTTSFAGPQSQASEPADVAIVRRFYDEIWNNWRVEVADEIVSPVVRFRGSLGIAVSGRDAFKPYVEGFRTAFPDWHNPDGFCASFSAARPDA